MTMSRAKVRHGIWIGIGITLVAGAVGLLRPQPLLVEAVTVTRGPLRATIAEEGHTRVRDLYTLAAPVEGDLERIVVEPGAALLEGSVVARIRPIVSRPLDARSRAEAAAAVVAAREAVARADAGEEEARVAVAHAESKLARTQVLAAAGAVPPADFEHGGHELQMARQNLESARAAARQVRADLSRAMATIASASVVRAASAIEVKSPVRGQVLRVLRESAGPVAAGAALVEVGNLEHLEIVADLLSSDAALVRPGAAAFVSAWGGQPLPARVRRVDPSGFLKVSALGLEEQRVHVILDLAEPPPVGLGHDYRVNVAIVVWEGNDVLRVPSTALFRVGGDWTAFAIRDGRARLSKVGTGASDAASTVVASGLVEGEKVIPQPSDALSDGTRVEILREEAP
jgi:HlyD family secretion protein